MGNGHWRESQADQRDDGVKQIWLCSQRESINKTAVLVCTRIVNRLRPFLMLKLKRLRMTTAKNSAFISNLMLTWAARVTMHDRLPAGGEVATKTSTNCFASMCPKRD